MRKLLQEFNEAKELPHKLSDLHYKIAAHFGETSSDYEDMIPEISRVKRTLMDQYNTTKAEREYEISETGRTEKKIKIRLKSLAVLLSAVRRRIETLDKEAQNQF